MNTARRALTLLPWQDLPSRHDDIVKNLETQICIILLVLLESTVFRESSRHTLRLRVLGIGEDLVDHEPGVRVFFELFSEVSAIVSESIACAEDGFGWANLVQRILGSFLLRERDSLE